MTQTRSYRAVTKPRDWVNTVSLDHVLAGVAGGFTQAGHGSDTRLRMLHAGDRIVFYSPRTAIRTGRPLQCFTALGVIVGDEPYQVSMSADFHPWRLAVRFVPCVQAPVKPLIPRLSFIADPRHWGLPFRRGLFAIPQTDYDTIAETMRPESQ